MPLKTEFDPKTGKMKTYHISPLGMSVTEKGRPVAKSDQPRGVQKKVKEIKAGGPMKIGTGLKKR